MRQHSRGIAVVLATIIGIATVRSDVYADGGEPSSTEIESEGENIETSEGSIEFDIDPVTVGFPAPISVYETKNYSPECDISQSTPPGTHVLNAMSAAAITGEIDVARETVEQDYEITFACQMHYTAPKWDPYTNELQDSADYYENFSFTSTLTASIAYQYIASVPHVYSFENMKVYNRLFPMDEAGEGLVTYSSDSLEMPRVDALFRIHSLQAETSTENYVQLSPNMPLSDPYAYDYTPGGNGYHYSFYGSDELTVNIQLEGARAGDWADLTEKTKAAVNELIAAISSGTWSCNDYAQISDGTNTFLLMSDERVYGAAIAGTVDIVKDGVTLDTIPISTDTGSPPSAESQYQYGGAGHTLEGINDDCIASRITGFTVVSISETSDMSDAPTGIKAQYKNIFSADDEHGLTLTAGKAIFGDTADPIYDHVMRDGILTWHNGGDPDDGYPIRLQMSLDAIEIVDKSGHTAMERTQLFTDRYNADADNQLLLDSGYYIMWNDYGCAHLIWEDPKVSVVENFDKYVSAKYLRFPFDVVYNDTLYYVDEDLEYTDWIQIITDDWQMTPFYIPCFSQEGGGPGTDMYVEAKVVMTSKMHGTDNEDEGEGTDPMPDDTIPDETEQESDEDPGEIDEDEGAELEGAEGNTRIQVQLSGWLYGLSAVGTNNGMIYNGDGLLEKKRYTGSSSYSMAHDKMEIRSGVNNRLGTRDLRYLQDGSIANSTQETILPIRNGISASFPAMGNVWKGQEVSFVVKTLADLTRDNDSIEVIPDIYFQTPAGEMLSYKDGEIRIYVTDAVGNWSGEEYDPTNWDISEGNDLSFADPLLRDSYYDAEDRNRIQYGNWLQDTLEKENVSRASMMLMPLTMQQYLYRKVPVCTLSHISVSSALRLFSGEYEQLASNNDRMYDRDSDTSTLKDYRGWINFDEDTTGQRVRRSMQQWHFKYSVPTYVKVIDVRDKGGAGFTLAEYIDSQNGWKWNSDPDVYSDKGTLLICFQVTAYKEGVPYLRYSAEDEMFLNMWEREGADPEYPYGAVMIVDMARSMNDYYRPAIQNIN